MKAALLTAWILLALLVLCGSMGWAQEEPPLPAGLGEGKEAEEPTLPAGLEEAEEEPALPAGLEAPPETAFPPEEAPPTPFPLELSGFWEARFGMRTQEDPQEKAVSIGETRLQLELEKPWEQMTFRLTTDLLFDPVLDRHRVRLERGEGVVDLREANLALRPTGFMDIKIGRQILTWGTGDLIFINDLFPKDWNAFFIGRDPEYLKAPSDALKVSLFSSLLNLDLVYTPRFDPDRFIDGRRISFFNTRFGRRTGRDAVVEAEIPNRWFHDDELAWRLYKTIKGYELAVYGYRGFWKSPGGMDPASGRVTFPPLAVYGASIRGVVGKGIGHLEIGYYDSEDDRQGDDPLIRNSEFRFLIGYEQEVAKNFTVGLQYNLEHMMEHAAFRRSLPPGSPVADENRHLLTLRLTKLLWNQDLELSLFTFYSPSDNDAYLRPRVHYKINDRWAAEIGGNLFVGEEAHTFFGQFAKNTNLYVGVRYSF